MSKKPNSSRRSNKRPASARKPSSRLALGDIDTIRDELKAYHRLFRPGDFPIPTEAFPVGP
jgi:hypothetical protein